MERKKYPIKSLFFASVFGCIPVMLLSGIFAWLDYDVFMLNGAYVHGLKGLLTCILFIPVFALLITLSAWVFFNTGSYLHGLFRVILKNLGKQRKG